MPGCASRDEALDCYQKAQAAGFSGFELLSNRGTVLKDMGELDESLSCFQKSLAIKPDAMVESNLVYTLHFSRRLDAAVVGREAPGLERAPWPPAVGAHSTARQ